MENEEKDSKCEKCGMPMNNHNRCSCQPNICSHCCECEESCQCGCHQKKEEHD